MLDKHQVKAKTQELIVLFIEDNTSARRDMRAILDFYFYKVDVASDGKEGLEAYKKFYEKENFYYDLVITDLELPKLKGLELIKEIQKINPEQHIMISSAYNDYENLTNAINLGVDGFLQKPFNQKKFLEIMVNVANHINAADEEKFQKAKLEKLIDAKTREVQEQAKIDSFTLIPNFNALIEDINRSGEKALLVLDIDRFEDVNTTYGMEFGNSVLQRVAILLQDLVPENGRLYRIGSDEFGMLIIDPIENQLENLAETVSSFFRTYQIGINDVEIGLKFFMGISYEEHDFISGGRVAVKEAKLKREKL